MRRTRLAGLALGLLLAGCDLAPHYRVPETGTVPAAFKDGGAWTPATPAAQAPRGQWWLPFADPTLDRLETQLNRNNPTLAQYLARHDAAQGALQSARSALFPQLDFSADGNRARSVFYGDEHDAAAGFGISYEVDLWGQVRNQVKAARANLAATEDDVASARLSLQADLAAAYTDLRNQDAELDLLTRTVAAYRTARDLTRALYTGGAVGEIDAARATAQLGEAEAERAEHEAARAVDENAIADLLGENAAGFHLPPMTLTGSPPPVPVGAPSTLLERRPDIAAAERRVMAANAGIGVARAALFPSLTLNTSAAYALISGTKAQISEFIWALGPGVIGTPLYDAGLREGEVRQSIADWRAAAAAYRQTVLDAFRDVESAMASANDLAVAAGHEARAVAGADRALQLATVQYQQGATDYLQVVVAQTAALAADQHAITIRTNRFLAAIGLIRALGGGWQS